MQAIRVIGFGIEDRGIGLSGLVQCTGLMRGLYGIQVTDLGPYRAIRSSLLTDLRMQEMTFGWPTEMMAKSARRGARIVEVPVSHHARRSGRSKVSGTVKGSVLAAYYILGVTLRYRTHDPDGVMQELDDESRPVIFCLWHNQMIPGFLSTRRFPRKVKIVVLTSASKDGAGLAAVAESLGCGAVRGSSSRRGLQAMMDLKRELAAGRDVAITPDGPRGPRYSLQPGVVKVAQASGAPLFMLRFSCSSAWHFKTWDRLRLPKPFSTVTLTLSPPVMVPRRGEEEEFERIRVDLEQGMREGLEDLISENDEDD